MAEEKDKDAAAELAALFERVFGHGEGAEVLEVLEVRFGRGREIYVPGGPEGARETDRRAAHGEVLTFIYRQLLRAQRGDPNE